MIHALMDLPFFRYQFAVDHPVFTALLMLGLASVYVALYPRTR